MFPINDDTIVKLLRRKLNSVEVNILHWEVTKSNDDQLTFSFNGAALRFEVHYEFQGEKFTDWFFAKVPACSDTYDRNCQMGTLENEFMMYELVLPQINRVTPVAPILYYSCREDYTLILDDLVSAGYSASFNERFGLEGSLRVLQELARLHAASAKVLQIRADLFDWLNTKFISQSPLFSTTAGKQMIGDRFKKVVLRVDPQFWHQNAERLEDYRSHLFDLSAAERLSQENRLNVLAHGDCWKTNIMLKYDHGGSIKDVKFVDFQNSMVGSPALDVFFFIISSVQYEVFEQNADQLLAAYVAALNQRLQEFGCAAEYSVEQLQMEIDARCSFWIFVIVFWMAVMYSSPELISKKTVCYDGLMDGKEYVAIVNKWMLYFIQRSIKYPERKIFYNHKMQ